jgi:hypothetical protein
MHRPNRFHLSTLVFLPFFGWSGFWPLLAHRRCRLSFTIALTAPCPCRRPCVAPILVLALAPTHRTGTRSRTHSIDITPIANSHPPPPNSQIKQHHSLPPPPSPCLPVYSRSLCSSFWRAKHGKNNKCLYFMLYMIEVANTFNLWGFSFFPFVISFLWCLELQIVDNVDGKDKTKAKQSEGLCK